jgi:heme/copper-type cytochrome/quinol oxidase subunit 2
MFVINIIITTATTRTTATVITTTVVVAIIIIIICIIVVITFRKERIRSIYLGIQVQFTLHLPDEINICIVPMFVIVVLARGHILSETDAGKGPGSIAGLVKLDLWWTKWRWGRFSPSTSVSPANLHSTNCSTITLTYHLGLVQ